MYKYSPKGWVSSSKETIFINLIKYGGIKSEIRPIVQQDTNIKKKLRRAGVEAILD
jgi:hypothetical protein